MRYLIIGGASVFARPLIERLISGVNFIVATKMSDENSYMTDDIQWVDLDIRDYKAIVDVLQNYKSDVIFHLAQQDSVGYAWKNPNETVDVNVIGTINLLSAVRECCLEQSPRIVIGGSGEEYGAVPFSELPVPEDKRGKPANIFGATKACQTMLCKLYAKAYDMDIVILRTFNETSIEQGDSFSISNFCHQFALIEAGQMDQVIKVGNINNKRYFTDVRDLARAFELVAQKGESGEVYNAARNELLSLKDLIDILVDLTGIDVEIKMENSRVRPMDTLAIAGSSSKLNNLGWEAEIGMRETLAELLKMWREKIRS